MTDLLRPSLAAEDSAERIALVLPDRMVTFGSLSALAAASDTDPEISQEDAKTRRGVGSARSWLSCVAEPSLATFVTLYAALERGVPFVPVHPRLPAKDREELLQTLERTPPPAGTAAVVFTSGTTGAPRGVCLSRENLIAAAEASAANLGWRDDDRWLCALPIAHVGGLMIPIRCLLARRAVVALPRFDETAVLSAIRASGVTLASFVPAMLARLLSVDTDGALASLRAILLGGDAAPPALLAACRARGVRVLSTYGLTEACSQVATQRPDVRPLTPGLPPLPGVEVRIDAGYIQVRGPSVAHSFLGEAPRAPDEWLDTGDLGLLDAQGHLHVTGRAKDLIITGGENVSPARVEAVLGRCPGIEAVLVYGAPDETWGQLVCAALVAGAAPPTDEDVFAFAASALAVHERPRRLVWVDALPRTPSGKLARPASASGLTGSLRTPAEPRPAPAAAGTPPGRP